MSNEKAKLLIAERGELLDELGTLSRVLHGSWVERFSTCSRSSCKCHEGKRHGPRRYLVINEDGRQRQKYIPNAQVHAALEGVQQHHRLLEIVDKITRINLALMKECDGDNW